MAVFYLVIPGTSTPVITGTGTGTVPAVLCWNTRYQAIRSVTVLCSEGFSFFELKFIYISIIIFKPPVRLLLRFLN
jgi:hypothetical protein